MHLFLQVITNQVYFLKYIVKGIQNIAIYVLYLLFLHGYFYTVNPYIPVLLCLFFSIFSCIITYNLIDIEIITNDVKKKVTIKDNINDIKTGFKYIITSKRLRALFLMSGLIWGLLSLLSTYQTTLLKNMSVSATYIGLIAAFVQIVTGLTSKKADDYNKKFSNKSLTIMALTISIGAIIIGAATIFDIPLYLQLIIIVFMFTLRHAIKGFYQILKNVYMGNFASTDILPKVISCHTIFTNLFRSAIAYVGSVLLIYNDIQHSTFIIGIVFTFIAILFSLYMKTRIGVVKK